MLKKIVVIAAVLMMAGSVFGAWSANKFTTQVPPKTIPDPCKPGSTLPNPDYAAFDKANYGTDRTVDWESDGNATQRKGESWNWPATYDYVPICDIRVQMDVGFWIKITGCRDSIIKLKQRMVNQYGGQTTCTAQTNVATQWKAEFVKKEGFDLGGYNKEAAVDPSTFDATGASTKVLTVKLKMWDVDLKNLPAGTNCLDIGWVRLSVRPTVRPNSFMSGCGGSYPIYSPPPVLNGGQDGMVWW
jgi:hypothetical protein